MEFYEAWNYLYNHKIFKEHFLQCLDIDVVKVHPETLEIDDDYEKNTKTQVWLECGPYFENQGVHDIDLDCGGDSFELAIINLAKNVKQFYDEGDNYEKYE